MHREVRTERLTFIYFFAFRNASEITAVTVEFNCYLGSFLPHRIYFRLYIRNQSISGEFVSRCDEACICIFGLRTPSYKIISLSVRLLCREFISQAGSCKSVHFRRYSVKISTRCMEPYFRRNSLFVYCIYGNIFCYRLIFVKFSIALRVLILAPAFKRTCVFLRFFFREHSSARSYGFSYLRYFMISEALSITAVYIEYYPCISILTIYIEGNVLSSTGVYRIITAQI